MKDAQLDAIVGQQGHQATPLYSLMPRRITNILLVSSLYDSFTFEEDGALSEQLFAEYLQLNLRYAPRMERVSTEGEAIDKLAAGHFDLVISMLRVGEMDIRSFSRKVKETAPWVSVILLAYNTRELGLLGPLQLLPDVDRVFVWHGDHRLFFAIIKSVEDRINVAHDSRAAGVQSIIVIEDSVRFYSSYLPMLYAELVKQTQSLMAEGVNTMQKLIRMRARPKILLATTFEEGLSLYTRYEDHILGVIVDVAFPRGGKVDPKAGLDFALMVRDTNADRPILMQSSNLENSAFAKALGATFIHKHSPLLLAEVRQFMKSHLGFGDFVFRMPDGREVGTATDLNTLLEAIGKVPAESVLFHAGRNHFSSWLMARTEFDLARTLRPLSVEQFEDAEAIRSHVSEALQEHRKQTMAGVVAEFSSASLDSANMFVKIGTGSLGGKGRGLAFMNSVFTSYDIKGHIPGVEIAVPPTAILATGVFDQFMEDSELAPLVVGGVSDGEVKDAFLLAPFPATVREDLRVFLAQVRYPLAVRSSSMLEDASFQPFAGVYRTYMIPNNAEELEERLEQLVIAVKLVYASTYYADARAYVESTPNRLEEEKMAVVIQQLVGRSYEHYHYPDFAGIVRSRNYYPAEGTDADDGVALAALGLGATVLDGGRCVRFSPKQPRRLDQFSSVNETLKNTQREFLALDLKVAGPTGATTDETYENLAVCGLDVAERHGTLHAVGSVYSSENDAVHDGISRPGVRLVTLSGVLKADVFPLADVLDFLMRMGAAGFSGPVEIEYAVKLRANYKSPHEFGFLQIRPLGKGPEVHNLRIDDMDPAAAICVSRRALGHGLIEDVRDIVYVGVDSFERSKTVEIAAQIGQFNHRLVQDGRAYLLVGQGRWGSADKWLGIPVTWSQISGASCIVETDMTDVRVEPSQGSHFFQNITSLGIGYFTVNFGADGGALDSDWLDAQPAFAASTHVRHVRLEEPLQIAVDSKRRLGVVMKPGCRVVYKSAVEEGIECDLDSSS